MRDEDKIGHITTRRIQRPDGSWEYDDPRNNDLAFAAAQAHFNLLEIDDFIEAIEASDSQHTNP